MKLLSSIALMFGLVPAKPSPKEKMDVACMMTAISAVENTRYDQIGMAGERSTFQLTRTVWLTHSDLPFEIASQNDAKVSGGGTESGAGPYRLVPRPLPETALP